MYTNCLKKLENYYTRKVYLAAIDLHNRSGIGLYKRTYKVLLYVLLKKQGVKVNFNYYEIELSKKSNNKEFFCDLLVENKIAVFITDKDLNKKELQKDVLFFLKISDLKLAIIINFNKKLLRHGFKRIVNNL